jgi:hypothetical protein
LFYQCYIYAFLLPSKDKRYMHKRTRTESPISHIHLAIKIKRQELLLRNNFT